MLPASFLHRRIPRSPKSAVLRCWYVRLVWPTSLIALLVFSLPRVTTMGGMLYLVVVHVIGIVARLHGANAIRHLVARPPPPQDED